MFIIWVVIGIDGDYGYTLSIPIVVPYLSLSFPINPLKNPSSHFLLFTFFIIFAQLNLYIRI